MFKEYNRQRLPSGRKIHVEPILPQNVICGFFAGAALKESSGAGMFIQIDKNTRYSMWMGGRNGSNTRAELLALWGILSFAKIKTINIDRIYGDSKVIIEWCRRLLIYRLICQITGVIGCGISYTASRILLFYTLFSVSIGKQIDYQKKGIDCRESMLFFDKSVDFFVTEFSPSCYTSVEVARQTYAAGILFLFLQYGLALNLLSQLYS